MTVYKPEQRVVKVDIISQRYRISGGIQIGKVAPFLEAVTKMQNFLKLVDVNFHDGQQMSFLALQHKAVQVIAPHGERPETIVKNHPVQPETRKVVCFLPDGKVEGELHLLPNVRLSDFIAVAKYYIPIHNPRVDVQCDNQNADNEVLTGISTALVNRDNVIGITDV